MTGTKSVSGVPIVLDDVTKIYPSQERPAVDRVSLELPAGRTTVFVGPSGCGKTTTMRMINRLIEPSSGTITIDGQDNRGLDADTLRRSIGYAIQAFGLFPHMTVAQNVGTVPRLLKWKKPRIRARVDEMLELVGLDPSDYRDRYPAQLSGGQQQRVGVARALAADPPVLLMDEPFGAVDPITRSSLQGELLRLQDDLRKTIVFVTHDFNEAVRLGDKIAVLGPGSSVLQFDTPEAILTNPADDTVSGFIGDDAALKTLTLRRVGDVDLGEATTARASDDPAEFATRLRGSGDEWVVVLDDAGRPLRWVRGDTVARMPDLRSGGLPVVGSVTVDSSLQEALDGLLSTASATTVVVDRDGVYRGTIGIDDLVAELRRINHRHNDADPIPGQEDPA
ncbi:ABC transporter ATP-binding protein [Dietzia cinnamea]|uniref:ABC transporter ATP-binding protein n=1 Tax=Dietzia cinnamea TaxID=321318 RepID=UPI0021AFA700|nr:ATP-binding cassette domain-containing protein [Dietzia cinnamea]MCT2120618.1 ATP-binding cassette domain-containing protein [Dietzia cinnamea]MCT2144944.1 ATP-binding cassette domain-containing protein [Dietzia cinnamea]MCT2174298.1 ATP-binding cassette domain-containing protein [Dietzia cinnamea]MCT2274087.1 ATP-binding cassette domain-containing protein [Dietzia cinnamea]MCT2303372.1 ATP-binding cassette domain-containing protein [Dietzia cinnamea]